MKENNFLYAICKEECGSINTTFYKYRKYKYEYSNANLYDVKVYNEIGKYVYFYNEYFKEHFYTEKEYRLEKLKKLYECNLSTH